MNNHLSFAYFAVWLSTKLKTEKKGRGKINFSLERNTGLEPAPSAWEAGMLPLTLIPQSFSFEHFIPFLIRFLFGGIRITTITT